MADDAASDQQLRLMWAAGLLHGKMLHIRDNVRCGPVARRIARDILAKVEPFVFGEEEVEAKGE
jgi:hypothetical protein